MAISSLEQWEKGYIAGVLDSDGALLLRRNGQSFSFMASVQFVGTFQQMLKIWKMLGQPGNVYEHGSRWTLMIFKTEDVKSLVGRVYEFLTKKDEANILLQMMALHNLPGKSVPWENIEKRIELLKAYKQHKARSGGHVTNWGELRESLRRAWEASYGNPEPSVVENDEGAETSSDSSAA